MIPSGAYVSNAFIVSSAGSICTLNKVANAISRVVYI